MKRIAKAAVVVAAVGASVLGTAGGALANTGDEGSYSSVSDNARDHENKRDEDNNRYDRDNNRYDRDNDRYDREDHRYDREDHRYSREDHKNTYFKEEDGDNHINANYCPAEPKQGGASLLALLPVTLLNDTGAQTICQAGNNNRAEQFNFSLL
ncbi:hypothetical protein ACFW9F_08250 [Streptomyces sp. NPDC059506]|uniref:Secreted protein n=1 Tax=Streptomyces thermolineatus TaxID=44033 RepID=A0ABP5Z6S7_9ACTN|nr:hypothetical protein [Streptomyces sp. SCUT-3]PLW74593.1 hypothetical protein C0036_01065 [Streptomyces sp. DJ]QMV22305.1 hypothetical protein GQS52_11440 [Streptomyces sp. SCUT-3]